MHSLLGTSLSLLRHAYGRCDTLNSVALLVRAGGDGRAQAVLELLLRLSALPVPLFSDEQAVLDRAAEAWYGCRYGPC
jgi:hypothetical protein